MHQLHSILQGPVWRRKRKDDLHAVKIFSILVENSAQGWLAGRQYAGEGFREHQQKPGQSIGQKLAKSLENSTQLAGKQSVSAMSQSGLPCQPVREGSGKQRRLSGQPAVNSSSLSLLLQRLMVSRHDDMSLEGRGLLLGNLT